MTMRLIGQTGPYVFSCAVREVLSTRYVIDKPLIVFSTPRKEPTPLPHPNFTTTVIMSAQVGRFVTSKDGTKLWADDAGNKNGIPVIFVHGLSCTGHAWDKQFEDKNLLANLYMIRYELRGHSRSDKPMSAEYYTQQKYAEDFVAVSEAFGVKKPFICGWYVLHVHSGISDD